MRRTNPIESFLLNVDSLCMCTIPIHQWAIVDSLEDCTTFVVFKGTNDLIDAIIDVSCIPVYWDNMGLSLHSGLWAALHSDHNGRTQHTRAPTYTCTHAQLFKIDTYTLLLVMFRVQAHSHSLPFGTDIEAPTPVKASYLSLIYSIM